MRPICGKYRNKLTTNMASNYHLRQEIYRQHAIGVRAEMENQQLYGKLLHLKNLINDLNANNITETIAKCKKIYHDRPIKAASLVPEFGNDSHEEEATKLLDGSLQPQAAYHMRVNRTIAISMRDDEEDPALF